MRLGCLVVGWFIMMRMIKGNTGIVRGFMGVMVCFCVVFIRFRCLMGVLWVLGIIMVLSGYLCV